MREIRNVKLPDGRTVCIRHAGGRIVSIGSQIDRNAIYLDAHGLLAVPALNLMHVHFRVPGEEQKEDWAHGAVAAHYGGVATVGDQPNNKPPITTHEEFLRKIGLIGDPGVNFRLWFGATPRNKREVERVAGHPLLAGVKMFMGSSTGDLLVEREEDQRDFFQICAQNGVPLAVHSEDERIIGANLRLYPRPTVADHGRIRSPQAAVESTRRALRFQAETKCRLLILHVTTMEEAGMIGRAKDDGREVYAETCPHYWVFDDRMLERMDGGRFKMNPPLRAAEQQSRYLERIRMPGVFDFIAPDHAPHLAEEKEGVDYSIPSGIPGVQELFPLAWDLVRTGVITVEQFIDLTSSNAAKFFGLPNGKLEPGYAADIVLFDPDEPFVFRDEDMMSKCGWTAYHGMEMHGRPRIVFVGGDVKLNRDHH